MKIMNPASLITVVTPDSAPSKPALLTAGIVPENAAYTIATRTSPSQIAFMAPPIAPHCPRKLPDNFARVNPHLPPNWIGVLTRQLLRQLSLVGWILSAGSA